MFELQSGKFLLRPRQPPAEDLHLEIGPSQKSFLASRLHRPFRPLKGGGTAGSRVPHARSGMRLLGASLAGEAVLLRPAGDPSLGRRDSVAELGTGDSGRTRPSAFSSANARSVSLAERIVASSV